MFDIAQNPIHADAGVPAQSSVDVKRVADVVLASMMLVALAPLFLVAAAAVALSSRGPVFFLQERVGLNGKTFRMFKFRSMYTGAEFARRAQGMVSDRDGICFKSRNDPRVTTVGRFIRKYSIDELPQLFNVIRGDMSLVGPRPALPREVAQFPARAHRRHAVLPGITGIWQVSGRANVSFDQMIDMDLSYVASNSILMDLWILLKTAKVVSSADGAY